MRLKPLEPKSTDYNWSSATHYALVGKMTGNVHMVFDAVDEEQAWEVHRMYEKIRRDAGYELMKVENSWELSGD